MIVMNKRMARYLNWESRSEIESYLFDLQFVKIHQGYFFGREVNENLRLVADLYSKDSGSDWAGYEYSVNKFHLEDEANGSIPEIAAAGIDLVKVLANKFKSTFPNEKAVFWLGCDEFGEYPSVTLSFYVKREGMTPLLPEDADSLDKFYGALLIVV